MCGIAGMVHLDGAPIPGLHRRLTIMNDRIAHRGPDGEGVWTDPSGCAGLAHRRLSILDLSTSGSQPMVGADGQVLVHNGEIYNYLELRETVSGWPFHSGTDTEVILAAHADRGDEAIAEMRGMWAFALWNASQRRMLLSRDRFGIKPLYYAQVGRILYFASEIKAILPFLPDVETDPTAFAEYVTFQFGISQNTLFKGVQQLPPASNMVIQGGTVSIRPYWDVTYQIDEEHDADWFEERLRHLVDDSLRLHLRSDVPIGAYVSGGLDSSLVAILSASQSAENRDFFHGKFTQYPGFDESPFAEEVARRAHGTLHQIDITAADFVQNIEKVIYHLDQPVAGVGSFPQYMVSKLASEHVKVVLGGQGGDEIFGGYTRYLLGYLERALGSAIDGDNDPYVARLPLQDMAPHLSMLREYKPLMKTLFAKGMFGPQADRYLRLIGRASDINGEVDLAALPMDDVLSRYRDAFEAPGIDPGAHLDKMTRFDFRYLLPALLQVEDRMGMAHGLESRVPFLDHPIVEFAATLPPEIKLRQGETKFMLKHAFRDVLPPALLERRDKMGFPVPLKQWFGGDLREFVHDTFGSRVAGERPWIDRDRVVAELDDMQAFSRKAWGFLSLELWYREFHDKAHLARSETRALETV